MTSWMVPSPPQAKTVSLPSATAQRVLSVASWLDRQTVSSVRTPADWIKRMAWFSSASRLGRPELGLNRMVALRMRWLTPLSLAQSLARHVTARLTCTPLPHTERRLLRNGMSSLAGEHGDLSAMVRVVRDQIAEEASNIWT